MATQTAPTPRESATGWYTVRQFCARNACFSEASVRSFVFDARRHGLESAIMRAGRKVLIHEDRWFQAFARQQQQGGAQ